MRKIDLNSDLGEGYGPWKMGNDEALLEIVSSANIACGGHAGDNETMLRTIRLASQRNVCIGAHPGFEDKRGFGRRRIPLTLEQIQCLVVAQMGSLSGIARLNQSVVKYVKPHGALALWACEDELIAKAIVDAVSSVESNPAILAISGTVLDQLSRKQGVLTYSEIFADRGYNATGNLVPRSEPGALLDDPVLIVERILQCLETEEMPTVDGRTVRLKADSICVHGDGENALKLATLLRLGLERAGYEISPFI